jgi:hypothetical protein
MPVAQVKALPAPIGGLNTKDAIAAMPETDAIIADNWFIQPTWVETRNGYVTQATFTGDCETLMAYSGISGSNKLFGAVNNAGTHSIFRMDGLSGGAVGAAVVGGGGNTIEALTSTRFDWVQFGTGSAEIIYLVNGVDNPLVYDGTTWYPISGGGTYSITGVTTSTLSAVASYKQRLWFLQANTMNVYYLPMQSIGGAATQLNLAPNFALGGQLVSIITVSIDNAAGAQDYIAFVTNQGEIVVFQGYDPSQTATWQIAAKFRIGRPIGFGRRCWQKLGSDALMIGADGFILLSQALLTDRSQTREAVSGKIRKSVTDDVQDFSTNFGWQAVLYPIGNKVIVNVPTTTNSTSYQYVMNTLNNAWSTWNKVNNGYSAFCWEVMGDALYFGTHGLVGQADSGQLDGNAAITCVIQQAFSYFDTPGQIKLFTQARPIFLSNGAMSAAIEMAVDFGEPVATGSIPLITGNNTIWGSLWGSGWGGSQILSKAWIGITGTGIAGSLYIATQVANCTAQWQGTDIMYKPGGLFA